MAARFQFVIKDDAASAGSVPGGNDLGSSPFSEPQVELEDTDQPEPDAAAAVTGTVDAAPRYRGPVPCS